MAESSWPTVAGGHAVSDIQWEQMVAGFASDGVIGSPTDTPVVYGDATGMQVKVRANKLGLVRGHGWSSGTSEFTRAIGANSSGSTRIDLLVLRFTRADQTVSIQVKAGTAGAGAPALTQDPAGTGVYEIAVAQVTVASGATTINASNVANIARYIGPGSSAGRPKLYSTQAPTGLSGNWANTAGPTADDVNATGMFQISASRLTVDKQSPDSSLEVALNVSGYTSTMGLVKAGVRVMGTGYTSTNHVVATHYFNTPQQILSAHPNWAGISPQGVNYTQSDYPATSVAGEHWHAAPTHTHWSTVPAMHFTWSGTIHIPDLPVRAYTLQPWFSVDSGLTFYMDTNDHLVLRVAEV